MVGVLLETAGNSTSTAPVLRQPTDHENRWGSYGVVLLKMFAVYVQNFDAGMRRQLPMEFRRRDITFCPPPFSPVNHKFGLDDMAIACTHVKAYENTVTLRISAGKLEVVVGFFEF